MPARTFLVVLAFLSVLPAIAQNIPVKKKVPAVADAAKQKGNTTHTQVSANEKYSLTKPDSVLKPAGTVPALKSDGNEVSMESLERRKPGTDSSKTKAIPQPRTPQNKNEVSIETIEYRKQPVSPAKKTQKTSHPPKQ